MPGEKKRAALFVQVILLMVAMAILAYGCGSKNSAGAKSGPPRAAAGPCRPAPLEIYLQADSQINLNEEHQPMPMEVRVFLLKDRETFEQLDFETIWRDSQKALSKDLIRMASLIVFPGKIKIHTMKNVSTAAYVALVGIFRQPKGHQWKSLFDIREQNRRCANPEDLHTLIRAQIKGNRISSAEEG